MSSEPKGFSLSVLRESLLKAKGDSQASRGRIRRLKSELLEVDSRINEQVRQNGALSSEVQEMRSRRDQLLEEIRSKNHTLDEFMSTNCEFVKQKVVDPAEQGIQFAKETIECFNEIIASSYKLNMLFKRENPETAEASSQVDWAFPDYKPDNDNSSALQAEVLKLQLDLYRKQEMLRDAKNIGRGNKSKSGMFANVSKNEWDQKEEQIRKLLEEEANLELELRKLDDELNRPDDAVAMDTEAAVAVEMVQGFEPLAPAAVEVGGEFNNYSNNY